MWKFVAYLMEPRSALYEMLATLFSYPPAPETLLSIQQQLVGYEERLGFWDEAILSATAKGMAKAISQSPSPSELRADHDRLFMWTSQDGFWAAESAFRNPMLCASIARNVSAEYAASGFHRASWFSGPDDHVAVECLFMASMGRNFITMAQDMIVNPSVYVSHLERQHGFLSEHLFQWIPSWQEHVRSRGKTRLYRAAARLTGRLVETDHRKLIEYIKLIRAGGYNNYYRDRYAKPHVQEPCLQEKSLA
jgi:TorA maturation chaperone TorD